MRVFLSYGPNVSRPLGNRVYLSQNMAAMFEPAHMDWLKITVKSKMLSVAQQTIAHIRLHTTWEYNHRKIRKLGDFSENITGPYLTYSLRYL